MKYLIDDHSNPKCSFNRLRRAFANMEPPPDHRKPAVDDEMASKNKGDPPHIFFAKPDCWHKAGSVLETMCYKRTVPEFPLGFVESFILRLNEPITNQVSKDEANKVQSWGVVHVIANREYCVHRIKVVAEC